MDGMTQLSICCEFELEYYLRLKYHTKGQGTPSLQSHPSDEPLESFLTCLIPRFLESSCIFLLLQTCSSKVNHVVVFSLNVRKLEGVNIHCLC